MELSITVGQKISLPKFPTRRSQGRNKEPKPGNSKVEFNVLSNGPEVQNRKTRYSNSLLNESKSRKVNEETLNHPMGFPFSLVGWRDFLESDSKK